MANRRGELSRSGRTQWSIDFGWSCTVATASKINGAPWGVQNRGFEGPFEGGCWTLFVLNCRSSFVIKYFTVEYRVVV